MLVTDLIQASLSTPLKKVLEDIIQQLNNIPFNRKSIIFSGTFNGRNDFENRLSMIFMYLLKDATFEFYKEVDKTTWHIFSKQLLDSHEIDGAVLFAVRKAMVANIYLPPVIIYKYYMLNNLGFPLYFPIRRLAKGSIPPELIVYIGKDTQHNDSQSVFC